MILGKNQLGVLKALQDRSRGYIAFPWGCGWLWGTRNGTIKIIETLVKKGLVDKGTYTTEEGKTYPQYTISRAEAYTELAIKDGVCPNAMRDTMKMAMECGSVVACAKEYTKDHTVDLPSSLPRGGMGVFDKTISGEACTSPDALQEQIEYVVI